MRKGFVVEGAAIYGGHFVKKGTAENGVLLSGAGEASYGITVCTNELESIAVADHISTALAGEVCKVVLGSNLVAGAEVVPDASGHAVAIGTATGSRYFRGAILLESGSTGDLVDCIVTADWKTVAPIGSDIGATPAYAGQTFESAGVQYIAAYSTGAVAIGDVAMLTYVNTAGREVTASAPAANLTNSKRKIAVGASVNGGTALSWFIIGGLCEASVEGTTDVSAGDFITVLNGENDFKKDATTRTVNSMAVAVDAQAANSAVVVTVFLINELAQIGSPLDIVPTSAGLIYSDPTTGKEYISAYSTGARAIGDVVQLNYLNTAGKEVTAGDPASTAFVTWTAVASKTNAGTALSWFQTKGICEAAVEGTTDVAAGDFLEVLNTEVAFKKDGAARTANSGAIAIDAQQANSVVVVTVMLIGEAHVIAAA